MDNDEPADDNGNQNQNGEDEEEPSEYLDVSSPSHSGGISSTPDESDSDEAAVSENVDPYNFVASPQQNSSQLAKKKCIKCKQIVSANHFKKHVVTHTHDLWGEVPRGTMQCHLCQKRAKSRKFLINHLATRHNQLEEKLKENNKTIEQFEMVIDEDEYTGGEREYGESLDDVNILDIDTYAANAVSEMELTQGDLFSEEDIDVDDKGSDERGAPTEANNVDGDEEGQDNERGESDHDSDVTVPNTPSPRQADEIDES